MVLTSIDPQRVEELFLECLLGKDEKANQPVRVEGITLNAEFDSGRLEARKEEIEAMLDEMPDEFKKTGGGGSSFLAACVDKRGDIWTGMHQRIEQLFLLGMAVGKAELLLPRESWHSLPGGMPYFAIN